MSKIQEYRVLFRTDSPTNYYDEGKKTSILTFTDSDIQISTKKGNIIKTIPLRDLIDFELKKQFGVPFGFIKTRDGHSFELMAKVLTAVSPKKTKILLDIIKEKSKNIK